jgi:hypothetical protein
MNLEPMDSPQISKVGEAIAEELNRKFPRRPFTTRLGTSARP